MHFGAFFNTYFQIFLPERVYVYNVFQKLYFQSWIIHTNNKLIPMSVLSKCCFSTTVDYSIKFNIKFQKTKTLVIMT
jgi:hypothetical protein